MPASVRRLSTLAGVLLLGCGRVGYDLLPAPAKLGAGGHGGLSLDASVAGSAGQGGPADGGSAGDPSGVAGGGGSSSGGSGNAAGASGGSALGTGGAPPMDAATPLDASMSDAAPPCSIVPRVVDPCTDLPALAAAPVIDGNLDCGLVTTELVPSGWTAKTLADGATGNDTVAEYAVAWRPDGLYFYVDVTDPSIVDAEPADVIWYGDSVELYVDSDGTFTAPPAYDDPGTRQLIVSAPAPTSRGGIWAQQVYLSAWPNADFASRVRPGGYIVEGFVTAADLGLATWTLANGQHVGLDLAINVSFPSATETGGSGHRLGQYFLRFAPATGSYPYSDVRAFCTPTLGN